MKNCKKCSLLKEYVDFPIDKKAKDKYANICKKCVLEKRKIRYHNDQTYREKNKARSIKWGQKNKERVKNKNLLYRKNNKSKIKEYKKQYEQKRCEKDPAYKMRKNISKQILKILKKQSKPKNDATWSKLPYTPQQLKEHLESLWEPWMNWNNYGNFDINCRIWNIDHIIPQSKLLYDSMDHPNFLKCWALDNLRPLEAIVNFEKGNR